MQPLLHTVAAQPEEHPLEAERVVLLADVADLGDHLVRVRVRVRVRDRVRGRVRVGVGVRVRVMVGVRVRVRV